MGLLNRLRGRLGRDRIPTELFVPAPAFPAYQPGPLVPDFIPSLPAVPLGEGVEDRGGSRRTGH
jgi:hypothetical protein